MIVRKKNIKYYKIHSSVINEQIKVFRRMEKCSEEWKSVQKNGKVFRRMKKCSEEWKSVQKNGKVF